MSLPVFQIKAIRENLVKERQARLKIIETLHRSRRRRSQEKAATIEHHLPTITRVKFTDDIVSSAELQKLGFTANVMANLADAFAGFYRENATAKERILLQDPYWENINAYNSDEASRILDIFKDEYVPIFSGAAILPQDPNSYFTIKPWPTETGSNDITFTKANVKWRGQEKEMYVGHLEDYGKTCVLDEKGKVHLIDEADVIMYGEETKTIYVEEVIVYVDTIFTEEEKVYEVDDYNDDQLTCYLQMTTPESILLALREDTLAYAIASDWGDILLSPDTLFQMYQYFKGSEWIVGPFLKIESIQFLMKLSEAGFVQLWAKK